MRDLTEFIRDIVDGAIGHRGYGFIGDCSHDEFADAWTIEDRYDDDKIHRFTATQVRMAMEKMFMGCVASSVRDDMKVSEEHCAEVAMAMLDEDYETQLDVLSCLAIIEIVVFGRVSYC